MAFDRISLLPILDKAGTSRSLHYGIWDDTMGFCGRGSYSDISGVGYVVVQLDGTLILRNAGLPTTDKALMYDFGRPDTPVWANLSGVTFQKAELRSGWHKMVDGAPAPLLLPPLDLLPIQMLGYQTYPMAVLPDRVLFMATRNGAFVNSKQGWLVSFPRDPAAEQVFTFEYFLGYMGLTSPRCFTSREGDCVWLGMLTRYGDPIGYPILRVLKYHYKTKTVSRETEVPIVPDYPGDNVTAIGFSQKLGVLAAAATGRVYVFDEAEAPYAISDPERVVDDLPVVSVVLTNPVQLRLRGSVDAWKKRTGLNDGDRVFISDNPLFLAIGGIAGRTFPFTKVDDNTISIPVDGATILRPMSGDPNLTVTGAFANTDCHTYLEAVGATSLLDGSQIRFDGWPSGEIIQGAVATVLRTTGDFPEMALLDLDLSGWTKTSSGHWKLHATDNVVAVKGLTVRPGREKVGLIAVDLTGTYVKFTVDSPTWFDEEGFTGSFELMITQQGLNLPSIYSATATRVAADQFTFPILSSVVSGTLTRGTAAGLPTLTAGKGVPLEVRVTGSLGAPCDGVPVSWSSTAGSFIDAVSKTNAEGYARSVFMPAGSGPCLVTTSVEAP